MDIDIILEPDVSPQQMAELGIEAERLGIRALWSSNYHMHYDAFLALAPVATATSKLIIGPLAISPWEMHPLKMANAILTLNEMSNGRAMIGVSGGGGLLGALGWKARNDGPGWPSFDPDTRKAEPDRRLRATRECIEVLLQARSGNFSMGYEGGIFEIRRPWGMAWAKHDGPLIYSCASGPKMIQLGARIAEGIQLSDFTPDMMPAAMQNVHAGLAKRATPADDFRVGNFWAWHIKQDRAASMYEARRELIWRGAVVGMIKQDLMPHLHDEAEYDLMLENWDNFRIAFRNRSGNIEGVPDELVSRLIAGMSSAGDFSDIEKELDRYQKFAKSGLTELSIRLFDDPMDGLKMIGEHVLPALQQ
ncbi:MAG: LLM class flavin-dependent oxidoreductase [Gammaproteobacteria bacterium]|nr:MAG: LLM class flavin-dependent oxidoreductase [Gammaproteobacteria bacterium]